MRKSFKYYALFWFLLVALFNFAIFVLPNTLEGKSVIQVVNAIRMVVTNQQLYTDLTILRNALLDLGISEVTFYKFSGSFWSAYIFIMLAFVGQLAISLIAFKETNRLKFVYNLSVITYSYAGMLATVVAGLACIFIPYLPLWVGYWVCGVIMIITLMAVVVAAGSAESVSNRDDEIKAETEVMKKLVTMAEANYKAESNTYKKEELKKVYEALRYSDPISNKSTKEIEKLIIQNLGNPNKVLALIEERNAICKLSK